MRLLGLDYGKKRVGVALSDELQMTAQPYATWSGLSDPDLTDRIRALCAEKEVEMIILGLPVHMRGDESVMSRKIRRLAARLEHALPVPVVLWDERLTSVHAHRTMHLAGVSPGRNKGAVDRIAAALLLENFMTRRRSGGYGGTGTEGDAVEPE